MTISVLIFTQTQKRIFPSAIRPLSGAMMMMWWCWIHYLLETNLSLNGLMAVQDY